MISNITISVRYSEVDKMNIVYYSRYLEYFEIGRADWLMQFVFNYATLETEYKIGLPVIECNIQYKKPAKYSDMIILKTSCDTVQLPKILQFNYELFKGNELLVTGFSKHLFYRLDTKKVTTIPKIVLQKIIG